MQDGFNLAWKLAYVLKGFADPNLLESYTAERAPVGKQIVARANQSRKDYALLKECFNFGNGVDTTAKLLDRMRDPSPAGVEVRMNLQKALEIKSREFNAQGVELNQRYESSAIKADPRDGAEVWSRDKELYLQATTRPGAKLPHAWLVDETGHRISTLDVVGKGQMTLITGLAGQAWVTAAERLNQPFLKTVVTGAKGTADLYCDWQAVRAIHEAGAVLVRPDGYVAWRQSDAVWAADDAASQLQKALQSVLG
jgi:2,4-dichlorophenol 6-monooxygenase